MGKEPANLKQLMEKNQDLPRRMERENWRIYYDRFADLLVIHGKYSESSEYLPLNIDGVMVRVSDDSSTIEGIGIENFRGNFVKKHSDIGLLYLPVTNPLSFYILAMPILLVARAVGFFSPNRQRNEITEYISQEIVFGAAAS